MSRVAIVVAVVSASSCASTVTLNRAADVLYYEQTTQVLRKPDKRALNPDDIDFIRYRHGGSVKRDAGAKALQEALRTASADGKQDEALALADRLLRLDFTDLEGHLFKASYLYDHGDRRAASFHE